MGDGRACGRGKSDLKRNSGRKASSRVDAGVMDQWRWLVKEKWEKTCQRANGENAAARSD